MKMYPNLKVQLPNNKKKKKKRNKGVYININCLSTFIYNTQLCFFFYLFMPHNGHYFVGIINTALKHFFIVFLRI